jgi:glycosyltransferase 2 family protein
VKTGISRLLIGAIGLLGSIVLMGWAFFAVEVGPPVRLVQRFSITGWAADLPTHFGWLLPFVLLTMTLAPLRALLWGTTLPEPVPRYGTRLVAIALGALLHNVLPGRLGPLGSAYVLGRRTQRPVAEALASLLMAKFFEFLAVVAMATSLLILIRAKHLASGNFSRLVATGVGAAALFSVVLLVFARFVPRTAGEGRFRRLRELAAHLSTGMNGVGSVKRFGLGLMLGLAPVAVSTLAYGNALDQLGAAAGFAGGGLILGALTLGQFTPGLPVGTGVYYAVGAWSGRELGLTASQAAALAVLSHAATAAAHVCVGLVAAFIHRRELPALLPRRRRRSK